MTDTPPHNHGPLDFQHEIAGNLHRLVEGALLQAGVCSCDACVLRTLANGIVHRCHELVPAHELDALNWTITSLTASYEKTRKSYEMDDAATAPGTDTPQ